MNNREEQLTNIIEQMLKPIKNIPFDIVVKSLFEYKVIPFDIVQNQDILNQIIHTIKQTSKHIQQNPIARPRPNEVGNDMEEPVLKSLIQNGINAKRPLTKVGKGKSTGYPDLFIASSPYPIYLEVKTFAHGNYQTTQRSFYLSPSDNAKITCDAHHLLIGFEMLVVGEIGKNKLYAPQSFEIVELYGLECDMKSEFNSDNKRLYSQDKIIHKENI
jgi:hypothetical protein